MFAFAQALLCSQTSEGSWKDAEFERLRQQYREFGVSAVRDFAPPVFAHHPALSQLQLLDSPHTPSSQTLKLQSLVLRSASETSPP